MTDVEMIPGALRADAALLRHVAYEIAETSWPAVRLEGSSAAAAAAHGPPLLARLSDALDAWADGTVAAADELERADHSVARGLSP